MNKSNILIAGVGGQGSIFLSRLLGNTAISCGFNVRGSETIGMAQRGGSVVSHIRISNYDIDSPMIPTSEADCIIALEPGEGARAAKFLKDGGVIITSDKPVNPIGKQEYDHSGVCKWITEAYPGSVVLDGEGVIQKVGARSFNVALLGACVNKGLLPFDIYAIEETLKTFGKPEFAEKNIEALRIGSEL
jgi:indolepyruvate ferredoxin oxidoreductase beta subunit